MLKTWNKEEFQFEFVHYFSLPVFTCAISLPALGALQTGQAGWCMGVMSGCSRHCLLPKTQGTDRDNVAARSGSSPARAHPTALKGGRQGWPGSGSQLQPGVQSIRQFCDDETGLTSSQEVNPQVRIRPSKANNGQTQPSYHQAGPP